MLNSREIAERRPRAEERAESIAPVAPPVRLQFLDELRGVSIAAVILFHFRDYIAAEYPQTFGVLGHGYLGVYSFFVVSGYVIAKQAGRGSWSLADGARFIARRSIRLDPPYWVTIASAVALKAVIDFALHQPVKWPDGGQVGIRCTERWLRVSDRDDTAAGWRIGSG